MIAKLTTGNGFSGTLKYDLRDGQLVEKKGAVPETVRVLDAKDVCFDYDDEGNMILDVKQVAWDFRQQAMAYAGRNPIEKPVYHWALAYHPDDVVSDEQMLKDTEEFLDKMGFGNTQYVVIAHHDTDHPHVHVIANIVDNDSKRIPTYKMIDKAHKEAAKITKDRGYTWGESANKETVAHKPHEKVRMLIKPIIKQALTESISFDQLQKKLEKHGISCMVKQAADGKRGGISFGYEYNGQQHTFKGSSVDRKLSFSYIKNAMDENKANMCLHYIIDSKGASIYYGGSDLSPERRKKLEPLRQAVLKKGYAVSEIKQLKEARFEPNHRFGTVYFKNDSTIAFFPEKIVGDPSLTAPKAPTPTPAPTPESAVVDLADAAKLFKNKDRRADGEDKDKKNQKGVKL